MEQAQEKIPQTQNPLLRKNGIDKRFKEVNENMTTEEMAAPVEAVEAANASQPVVPNPEISITAQDLMYLYQVLLNSNVPSRDAGYVVNLQQKLQTVLNIQQQGG